MAFDDFLLAIVAIFHGKERLDQQVATAVAAKVQASFAVEHPLGRLWFALGYAGETAKFYRSLYSPLVIPKIASPKR